MTNKRRNQMSADEAQGYCNDFNDRLRNAKYLIAIDFEATCDEDRTKIPRDQSEIIEFGVVIQDVQYADVVNDFQRFVRPVIHPQLSDFCKTLTTITQDQVDEADTFAEVCEELSAVVEALKEQDDNIVWISWGQYDYNQLENECRRNGIRNPLAGIPHVNLKGVEAALRGRSRQIGLDRAIEAAGLEWEGTHHRGIDDAQNVVRVFTDLMADFG